MRKLLYYIAKYDYGLPSPFSGDVPFELSARDGTRISGTAMEGDGDFAFVVVHGLFAHHRAPGFADFAQSLQRFGSVFTFDLRGHGLSAGICTMGNLEALDVAAVIAHARTQEDRPIVAIGFSMGAAAALRAAALYEPVDAVVSISGLAEWQGPRRRSANVLRLMWKAPFGTTIIKAITGVRIDRDWVEPESPVSVAGRIAPAPLLVVHARDDGFFPPEEAEKLFASANEPKELWLLDRGGHADGLFHTAGRPLDRGRVDRFAGEVASRIAKLIGRSE